MDLPGKVTGAIAPGFIDLHNHSDDAIVSPNARANVNFLTQGCTTIVTGNCGGGPVDVAAYLAKIDAAGAGTNVIHLLPHGTLRTAVAMIEKTRAEGQRVTADQYPYLASSTSLEATLLPAWAREGGGAQLRKRLDDAATAARIRAHVAKSLTTKGRIQLASFNPQPAWVGKSLDEIAAAEQQEIPDLVLEIERRGGARVVNFSMSEEDVRLAMRLPWVATASDGSAKNPDGDQPHPRSFGTFSRKIGWYAQREKVVSLAQAVRSSSGLPADILDLKDRGYLQVGMIADLVVFDPRQLIDRATYDNPYAYSTGLRYVFVRGVPALYDGVPTGALAGRAIRRGS